MIFLNNFKYRLTLTHMEIILLLPPNDTPDLKSITFLLGATEEFLPEVTFQWHHFEVNDKYSNIYVL